MKISFELPTWLLAFICIFAGMGLMLFLLKFYSGKHTPKAIRRRIDGEDRDFLQQIRTCGKLVVKELEKNTSLDREEQGGFRWRKGNLNATWKGRVQFFYELDQVEFSQTKAGDCGFMLPPLQVEFILHDEEIDESSGRNLVWWSSQISIAERSELLGDMKQAARKQMQAFSEHTRKLCRPQCEKQLMHQLMSLQGDNFLSDYYFYSTETKQMIYASGAKNVALHTSNELLQ